MLRKARPAKDFPYKMPLFPLPVFVGIAIWLFILWSTGMKMISYGLIAISAGAIVYFIKAKANKEWPFANGLSDDPIIKQTEAG